MAVFVVDRFQFVQVQEEQRENVAAALGPAHFTLQRIHEFAVIGQPRQCIVCRFVTDLILALLSFCNVDARGDATFDFT